MRIAADVEDWLDDPDDTDRIPVAAIPHHVREALAAYVAEYGSRVSQRLTGDELAPTIIETDDFEEIGDPEADGEYGDATGLYTGWYPLGVAHQTECGWMFPPSPLVGTWVGWWEPDRVMHDDGDAGTVWGALVGFIVVFDGDILFAHVVPSYRRQGIAAKLIAHARSRHQLRRCPGLVTDAGAALVAATGLDRPSSTLPKPQRLRLTQINYGE